MKAKQWLVLGGMTALSVLACGEGSERVGDMLVDVGEEMRPNVDAQDSCECPAPRKQLVWVDANGVEVTEIPPGQTGDGGARLIMLDDAGLMWSVDRRELHVLPMVLGLVYTMSSECSGHALQGGPTLISGQQQTVGAPRGDGGLDTYRVAQQPPQYRESQDNPTAFWICVDDYLEPITPPDLSRYAAPLHPEYR
jgi:hypothetical protein